MNYADINLEVDQRRVAWLTLNRPQKHNAIGRRMMLELCDACAVISNDHSIRAVVLAAAGEKSFSAGADLGWMKENLARSRAQRIRESAALADVLEALNRLNKITIARVHGAAYAGGVGLIAVCDVAISVSNARFSLTETRMGLIPANIAPYLIDRMGLSNARRTLLNGHVFDANEAVQFGLIDKVVEPANLDQAIEQELQSCLACAPGAIAMTKQLLRNVSQQTMQENREYTAKMLADAWETEEAVAGISGFFEKKPPPWIESG